MAIECKYPHIEINCDDVQGTTPGVVLAVTAALERGRVSEEEILDYQREAVSGDYYKALQASLRMVRFT